MASQAWSPTTLSPAMSGQRTGIQDTNAPQSSNAQAKDLLREATAYADALRVVETGAEEELEWLQATRTFSQPVLEERETAVFRAATLSVAGIESLIDAAPFGNTATTEAALKIAEQSVQAFGQVRTPAAEPPAVDRASETDGSLGKNLGSAALSALAGTAAFAAIGGLVVATGGVALPVLIAAGALGGAASGLASTWVDGRLSGDDKSGRDYASAATFGALTGGLTGGVGGTALSATAKVLTTGIGAAGIDQGVDMTLRQQPFDLPEMMVMAVVGTVLGKVTQKLATKLIPKPAAKPSAHKPARPKGVPPWVALARSVGKASTKTQPNKILPAIEMWIADKTARQGTKKLLEGITWVGLADAGVAKDPQDVALSREPPPAPPLAMGGAPADVTRTHGPR